MLRIHPRNVLFRTTAGVTISGLSHACSVVVPPAGLQLVDQQLAALHVGPTTTEASLDHISTYEVRSCLVLRVLLLEVQQQLLLLSTSYAAACQTACESIALLQRFPGLLGGMRPSVHLAAGLYAQSMNAFDEAQAHYAKAAASHDRHMRVCGQCMAALCILAQEGIPKAGGHREECGVCGGACVHAASAVFLVCLCLWPARLSSTFVKHCSPKTHTCVCLPWRTHTTCKSPCNLCEPQLALMLVPLLSLPC